MRQRSAMATTMRVVAGTVALFRPPATGAQTRLAEPIPISFRLHDGRDVRGEAHGWDGAGFHGTFGVVQWRQLDAAEAWHVHAALIDPGVAEHWLSVGRVLAGMEGGRVYAERALRWASWLGRQAADAADSLLAQLPPAPDGFVPPPPHAHRDDAGPVEPWPELTGQQQVEAVAELRNEAESGLAGLGLSMSLHELPFALVYTDLPENDLRVLLEGLRATYLTLLKSFDLPPDRNVFWGKLVVIICNEQPTFGRIMRAAFASTATPGMAGIHVARGPRAYLLVWRHPDRKKLKAAIPHELAHAFLQRYRSPAALPLWLDEGFAEFIASRVPTDSPVDRERRPVAEWFIREGGPVENVLDMRCLHDGWPGPYAAACGVSYLLVEEMFRESPSRALACFKAIKDGKAWEQALAEDLGMTREDLVERLTERVDRCGILPRD